MLIDLNKLVNTGNHYGYWLSLAAFGLSLECVALYYQYVLNEMPCVLCIHVRLWVSTFILISIMALVLRWSMSVMHALTAIVSTALVERSYQLLGTERGWTFGSCGFDLGLPDWFAIEVWLPALFRVETSCGYTPELLFGITMAEALLVMSASILLISITLLIANILNTRK